jgi:hypothetical protein
VSHQLPEPDYYWQDQILGVGVVVGKESPKPDCPALSKQCFGLYAYSTVKALEDRIQELEAENKHLRQHCDNLEDYADKAYWRLVQREPGREPRRPPERNWFQ